MLPTINIATVEPGETDTFIARLIATFGAESEDPNQPIVPLEDVQASLSSNGAEALDFISNGKPIGGAIVTGDDAARNLDFLFIQPEYQDKHFGYASWQALEQRYPNARRWRLVTPYDDRRNIHFYVNRCGFSIVEYYNDHHPDPHRPEWVTADDEGGGLFVFEKTYPASPR